MANWCAVFNWQRKDGGWHRGFLRVETQTESAETQHHWDARSMVDDYGVRCREYTLSRPLGMILALDSWRSWD